HTSGPLAANDVLIGLTLNATAVHFFEAVNAGANAGTDYGTGTTANVDVTAADPGSGTTVNLTAKCAGTVYNGIVTGSTGSKPANATVTNTILGTNGTTSGTNFAIVFAGNGLPDTTMDATNLTTAITNSVASVTASSSTNVVTLQATTL